MASTNKTPNYNLNQWLSSDKPKMNDYNDDNLKIDTELNKFEQRIVDLESNSGDGGGGGTVSGGGSLGAIINLKAKAKDGSVHLTWEDPADVTISGSDGDSIIAQWKETVIIRSETGFPTNLTDGVEIARITEKDKHRDEPYIDTTTNEVDYFYTLFPIDIDGNVIKSDKNQVKAKYEIVIYTVAIYENNLDPEERCVYEDHAVGMQPVRGNAGNTDYGDWKDTFLLKNIKPCVLAPDRTVAYYLNPDNLGEKEDGTPSDLTGADGNVMIEIPKMWVKCSKVDNVLRISISNHQVDGNYKCLAHLSGNTNEHDFLYISMYAGYVKDTLLYSVSGVTPTTNVTLANFTTYAKNNGSGYYLLHFYPLQLLQQIYTLLFKSTDSQTALGRGYVDENTAITTTGNTNDKGMLYGETTGKQQCKMLIEDLWGNLFQFLDGATVSTSGIMISTPSGTAENVGIPLLNNSNFYPTQTLGGDKNCFLGTNNTGSTVAGYCDAQTFNSTSNHLAIGSLYSQHNVNGIYRHHSYTSTATATFGTRLMALS